MAIAPNNPRLTLRFVDKSKPELRATEFSPPKVMGEQSAPILCTEGKSGEGQFEWREGVQSLCICLIRYLCYPKSNLEKGIKFQFEGGKSHPAKTMDGNVAKANKANCWQQNVFGSDREGSCLIKKYIKRKNPNPITNRPNYILEIQHDELPQESIAIELEGKIITDRVTLEKLADAIEDQWYEITGHASAWGKIKEARKQLAKTLASKKITTTIEPAKKPEELKPVGETVELPHPAEPPKSLAELFKPLSVASIISHITAAMLPARGNLAIEKFSDEILSPECVNVLAEKLVSESIGSFNDFFCATFEPPWESLPLVPEELNPQKIKDLRFEGPHVPDVKRSVGVFIASNRDLRQRLASMVARCGFSDMWHWFTAISFCRARESEREIVLEVERELGAAAVEEPDFKEKFLLYAPDQLPKLIQYFSDYDCVVAARLFEKINQEGREEKMRIQKLLYGGSRH